MRRRWTTKEIETACAMYRAGADVSSIVKTVGHPKSSVWTVLRRHGVRRRRVWQPEEDAALLRWQPLTHIAQEMGRTADAVRKRRQRLREQEELRWRDST